MKKLVISLLRRPDRKVSYQKNELSDFQYIEAVDGKQELFRNINAREDWLDPFKKRPLQQNEVACFLSHIKAWKKCIELNKNVIVMEDDAIINDKWDEDYFNSVLDQHDFLYLQRNENEPKFADSIDDKLEIPFYPYNMTAYAITPDFCKYLLTQVNYQSFIPVDEFMPEIIRGIKQDQIYQYSVVALKDDACNQISRDISESDIENSNPFFNYKVYAVTCGTDRKKCNRLMTSARYCGIDVINIGNNVDWKGTDMQGLGGGMKINLMKDFLEDKYDDDVVLFTDAYDVFYNDNLETIHERFLQMDHEIIFSGEMVCWPKPELMDNFPESPTRFRFINSGTYIGRVRELRKLMNHEPIEHHEDDQLFVHQAFFSGLYDIGIDYECYIFQTNFEKIQMLENSQLWNEETGCCPCIYHGNGGERAVEFFENLYDKHYPKETAMFIPHYNKAEFLSKDMMLVDFMTQDQCERMIEIADKNGQWGSLDYDKFPAQEIRLKELGLWDELDKHWQEHIVPITERYWKPLQMYGLRDGFVMRYAMDTQVNLNLHHDASLVTGSVKLNDDYKGAELIYPRQGVDNVDVPVGKCILFAGQLTHGHECLKLKEGIKYSLTIWSCRYIGDTI